jgi:hypothetical protein
VSIEDQKSVLVKANLITATEADALVTNQDTASKTANLSITEWLTAAWVKLNAVIKANPMIAFTTAAIALGIAVGLVADRIYNAEKYAKKALDKSAQDVEKLKSEIDSLNSELKTTQNRIDELNAKENLSLVEQEELSRLKEANRELEREIRLKENLLTTEKKEANNAAIKYFNAKKDSLEHETSYEGVEIYEKTDYLGTVEERIEKLLQHTMGEIKLSEEEISNYKAYIENAISDFMKEDDYLINGLDNGILKRLDAIYERYDEISYGKGYIHQNKISGILEKVDFSDTKQQLLELGKDGNLSIELLSSKFPTLISYLDEAGISAEELYQYIMAISNPNAINYGEVQKQLIDKLGYDTSSHRQLAMGKEKLRNIGLDSNEAFEAFITVRAKYEGQTETWEPKDWIAKIQDELNAKDLNTDIEILSISSTVEQLNTKLKPAMDSIASAWENIFSNEKTTESIKEELKELENGGKVNLTLRPQVDTSELNAMGWNAGDGLATVFSSTFSNEDGSVAMNFTPIIADPVTGKYLGCLSPDELQEYAEGVIAGTRTDNLNLQIGAKFEGTYAIEQAEQAADKIHKLHEQYYLDGDALLSLDDIDLLSIAGSIKSELDSLKESGLDITEATSAYEDFVTVLENSESTGLDVKNAFNSLAQSIIDTAVTGIEDFETLKDSLGDLGVVNNEIIAFQALIKNTDALTAANFDLASATAVDIKQFVEERFEIEDTTQAIQMLTYQKMLNNMQEMDTSTEVQNMLTLAKEAGITGDIVENLTELEMIYQEVASGTLSLPEIESKLKRATELKSLIESEVNSAFSDSIAEVEYKPRVDLNTGDVEKAKQEAKEAIDSYMDYMEAALEAGKIDYKTYSTEVAAYLKDMYDKGKIAAADYHNYTKQMLEVQKSIYDKVHSAILRRLDKEIEFYEKQIDALEKSNKLLEKQKDNYDRVLSVISEVFDKEIERVQKEQDVIQDKIDLLQEENDENQRAIELDKAKYELARLQSQKNKKLYIGDKGYFYDYDRDAIREAQDNLANLELEQTIDALEKEKEELGKTIEELEKYKELWAEIPNAKEKAENQILASSILGANYEKVLLSGRVEDINAFKEQYISVQKQIDDNTSMIESYEEKITYYNELKQQWQDITSSYEESRNNLYAAQLLGADWEEQILSGRKETLLNFQKNYNEIQDAIVEKAYEAAEAIKNANADVQQELDKMGKIREEESPSNEVEFHVKTEVVSSKKNNVRYQMYHSGLEEGYVSSKYRPLSEDERLQMFQKFGKTTLKPGEVPAILKTGEIVMTSEQQDNMARNMQMLFSQGFMKNTIPQNIGTNANVQSINLTIGDIQLYGVQNVEDVGNQIVKRLPNVMLQAINKR